MHNLSLILNNIFQFMFAWSAKFVLSMIKDKLFVITVRKEIKQVNCEDIYVYIIITNHITPLQTHDIWLDFV